MGFITIKAYHLGEYVCHFFQASKKQIQDSKALQSQHIFVWILHLRKFYAGKIVDGTLVPKIGNRISRKQMGMS